MHFRELRTKILDMPFIYKDLEADLTNDFVELEFQSAEVGTAGGTSAIAVRIPAHQKLKDRPRALIMGGAGIGKTTFLRHSVMELIDRSRVCAVNRE
jgi:ABC-type transporter Mla maintaining outer membrane lipid asymmetry ATPase subunit MlaF